ncbi:cellulose biosynthesis protein BcsQ [Desulfobotulus alkaliphilus]|uniref:Cellulose biosynthesis protein BcsQ n=1 Tax=Desulfobotulus alkaliphilus TaxID=622671 RepID=A0A562R6V7_9BACT|nr:ParA family protein [Desulfobotulus alkaliphilus]TWI64832.1 cellulose biosynthesis protein BcsQ [Desulfobotulus alkaliphilus]
MQTILCFLNHNRDTGKTATARNLAAAGALSGKPALVIFSQGYPAFAGEGKYLSYGSGIFEDYQISGLFYMQADCFTSGDFSTGVETGKKLAGLFDVLPPETLIFWDTPSALSAETRTALSFSSAVFIPLGLEALSFDRLGPSLGLLEWVRRERQEPLPLLGMIPVCVRPDQALYRIFSGPAHKLFRAKMVPVPIPEDFSVKRAESMGRPVFCEDLLSPAAFAYQMLYRWISSCIL